MLERLANLLIAAGRLSLSSLITRAISHSIAVRCLPEEMLGLLALGKGFVGRTSAAPFC
jgi:hypothetical protein